jgi:hypothetical protein
MKLTVNVVLLLAAVVLFFYCALLYDLATDWPGNVGVLASLGLSAFAASFLPFHRSTTP